MRTLRWAGVCLAAIGIAGAAVLAWYRQACLPADSGTVQVAGLGGGATIARDAAGVPHIRAASEADALFALGYAHAQDRLWQIDFNRRIGEGRVAEIVGAAALDTDRFLRVLGIHRRAEQVARELDPESRALLAAYSAGINAWLDSHPVLPPEFLLARAPRPRHWEPADSIAWTLMMAWDLAGANYHDELTRLELAGRFTRPEIDEILPPYPGEAPLPVADYAALYRSLGIPAQSLSCAARALAQLRLPHPFGLGEGLGSNSWVVDGRHTKSGMPLLANDPHLGLSTPSVWYFARIEAPGIDVSGATLPGVPYVVLGRTRGVAWAFTNTGTDAQDLYLERIDASDPTRYRTPSGSESFAARIETIAVRGGEARTITVRETRHGPVVSDAVRSLQDLSGPGAAPGYVLALRWTALEGPDPTVPAIRAMNRAQDGVAFAQALRRFQVVAQNVSFADTQGHIGFIAAGRVPVRRPDNDLQGLAPAPGWDARYDWQGWLPFDRLPQVYDPPEGMIVTANQRITPPGYEPFLTSSWALPYRANRITELLERTPQHDTASFERIQSDVQSRAALELLQALRAARPATEAGRAALAMLLSWDGAMRAESAEPLLFETWMLRLRSRLFDEAFGPLADRYVHHRSLQAFLLHVLRGETRARAWCGKAPEEDPAAPCLAIAARALDDVATDLGGAGALPHLRWGSQHRAVFEHRPLSFVPVLGRFFENAVPAPGGTYTVDVGSLSLSAERPMESRHGPSLRAIYDLSGEGGEWMFAPGQSGIVFSPNYNDLVGEWLAVRSRPLAADPGAARILHLEPAK